MLFDLHTCHVMSCHVMSPIYGDFYRRDIHTEDVDSDDGNPIVHYLCWPAMKDMLVAAPTMEREHLAPDRRARSGL